MAKTDLNWITVDESTMASTLAKRLEAYREANKKAADAKAAFEQQFVAAVRKKGSLDEGFTLAFGYRFGRLSVAKVPEQAEKPKSSAKPMFKF